MSGSPSHAEAESKLRRASTATAGDSTHESAAPHVHHGSGLAESFHNVLARFGSTAVSSHRADLEEGVEVATSRASEGGAAGTSSGDDLQSVGEGESEENVGDADRDVDDVDGGEEERRVVRPRAPTFKQLETRIKEDKDTEGAHYAVYHIEASAAAASAAAAVQSEESASQQVERCRYPDMTFEDIEDKLTELTRHQATRDDGVKRIDINRFPLDVRYRVEEHIVPQLLARFRASDGTSGGSGGLKIAFRSAEGNTPPSFVDGRKCFIEFSGSSPLEVDLAFQEVKQYLRHSVRSSAKVDLSDGRLFEDVDLHDLRGFGDIEPNMLAKVPPHNERPFIRVRKHAVLISMERIRCVIGPRPGYLGEFHFYMIFGLSSPSAPPQPLPSSDKDKDKDKNEQQFHHHQQQQQQQPARGQVHTESVENTVLNMQRNISLTAESFSDETAEFHAYRAIFTYVNVAHDNTFRGLYKGTHSIMEEFESRSYVVSSDHLDDLVQVRKELSEFAQSLAGHRLILEALLEQPVVMAMMSLSEVYKQGKQDNNDYTAAAVLSSRILMRHARVIERIVASACLKVTDTENKLTKLDEEISLALKRVDKASRDTQNNVLVTNTTVTVIATFIGACGYVTGLFGMNADNADWLPQIPNVFVNIAIGTSLFIFVGSGLTIAGLIYMGLLPVAGSTRTSSPAAAASSAASQLPTLAVSKSALRRKNSTTER